VQTFTQREQGLQAFIADGLLAAQVAQHTAQPSAQATQLATHPPELAGMGIAADLNRRPPGVDGS
jgi:hypothetical protein